MANHRQANVIYVDTDTDIEWKRIDAIKYVGAASGTALVKSESSSGDNLWEHNGDVLAFEDVRLRDGKGFHVAVTNGAAVYLYSYM